MSWSPRNRQAATTRVRAAKTDFRRRWRRGRTWEWWQATPSRSRNIASRGTLRADRHLKPTTAAPVRLTVADRRRALAGLDPAARRLAVRVVDAYGDWDEASLTLVRAFARSAARIEQLEATGAEPAEIRREVRLAAGVARALDLEGKSP